MPVLWTGTGSARTQGGYNFRPDLLWIMQRGNSGMNVRLYDVVRGDNGTVMYRLGTNQPNAEDVDGDVTSLTSTGFTIGNDGTDHPNVSGYTYVGWGWGEGASNGFDIVGYTGNGYPASGTQNISHNLGVPPRMIIIKNRDRSSDWVVGHHYLGWNGGMEGLNDTNQFYTNSNFFNNTAPTSTVFTVGTDSGTNYDGDDFIAYLFAEVEGFSKGGLYERNGSTDGPFIYTGFRPALLLLKEYNGGGESWAMYDSTRGAYNPIDNPLFPDQTLSESYIESTYANEIDFLSNGFKLRTSDSRYNSSLSSYRYLFWAWAENPFGGSNVSPATAR